MACTMIAVVVGLVSLGVSQAAANPLKVFILLGQSNMVGMGDINPEPNRERFST